VKCFDDELFYLWCNFEIFVENGFFVLMVFEEYGGFGENYVVFMMVCEMFVCYGCVSIVMCYVMYMGVVVMIMFCFIFELIDKYICLFGDCKIGMLFYLDFEIGFYFWYLFFLKVECFNGGFKVNKKVFWIMFGGFVDFYVV